MSIVTSIGKGIVTGLGKNKFTQQAVSETIQDLQKASLSPEIVQNFKNTIGNCNVLGVRNGIGVAYQDMPGLKSNALFFRVGENGELKFLKQKQISYYEPTNVRKVDNIFPTNSPDCFQKMTRITIKCDDVDKEIFKRFFETRKPDSIPGLNRWIQSSPTSTLEINNKTGKYYKMIEDLATPTKPYRRARFASESGIVIPGENGNRILKPEQRASYNPNLDLS